MKKLFQSYLILGEEETRRKKTQELAKYHSIDLASTSPDIFLISPIKIHITIDQIRSLKAHIFQKPVDLEFKFIVIEQAEKMTQEAQNAILKILEEPPSCAIIVLEAQNESQLLPTILSRVVIKKAAYLQKTIEETFNLLEEKDIAKLLEKLSEIKNPPKWLDDQMILLYAKLKNRISTNQLSESVQISNLIARCAQTKKMIDANVNPTFALTNLIFSIHLDPNQSPQVSNRTRLTPSDGV